MLSLRKRVCVASASYYSPTQQQRGEVRQKKSIVIERERRGKSVIQYHQKKIKSKKMGWIVLEAMLPLGIIAGMLCVIGNQQYYIHKAFHGRPKHIGNDLWDVAMERRDKKLVDSDSK